VQKLNDACRQGSEEDVERVLHKMADFRAPAITGADFLQFEFPEMVVDTWLRLFRRERWMQDYMTEVQNPIMETLIGMNRPCTVGTQAMTSWVLTCLRRGTLEGVETHVGLMGSPGCMSAMMILNQILANGMARERVQWAEMVARCGGGAVYAPGHSRVGRLLVVVGGCATAWPRARRRSSPRDRSSRRRRIWTISRGWTFTSPPTAPTRPSAFPRRCSQDIMMTRRGNFV
jgi:hypothetical protein